MSVGGNAPVLFIAEAGVNHFGDIEKALKLVDLAADAGADVFKTQAFLTDSLVSSALPEWRDRLRSKEVSFDFLKTVKEYCDTKNIMFMCTAHDEEVLPWLDELNVDAFKVGSGEKLNFPYLLELINRKKPIILSTGMYSLADINATINFFKQHDHSELAILHCVTSYPIPYNQVNLNAMKSISDIFPGPVGYSDHTDGHHAVLGAVALGAKIIEKHISLDFNVPNAQDWKVSSGPDDLFDLIKNIRELEDALGTGDKMIQQCEIDATVWALKSIVAKRKIDKGEIIEESMLTSKRPGGGLPPCNIKELIGKQVQSVIDIDQKISLDDLK